ncbi:MAG: type II toxin-antitoxin system RelE/ParE family toxin [Candidatus Rokuibacteriota bacterium]
MATRRRRVVWTEQARRMLDDAVSYLAQDSRPAAERLLTQALEAASSLDIHSERGRLVPELEQPNIRQLLVQRYRLIYEVTPAEVQVLAFIHGARDLTGQGFEG